MRGRRGRRRLRRSEEMSADWPLRLQVAGPKGRAPASSFLLFYCSLAMYA